MFCKPSFQPRNRGLADGPQASREPSATAESLRLPLNFGGPVSLVRVGGRAGAGGQAQKEIDLISPGAADHAPLKRFPSSFGPLPDSPVAPLSPSLFSSVTTRIAHQLNSSRH